MLKKADFEVEVRYVGASKAVTVLKKQTVMLDEYRGLGSLNMRMVR
jgi:hypothetical protein